ncbi:MAG: glycoside hydrolase family 3 protein [Hellea sp.]|nr:glycoside hydrolase family 3 protein [Hellea sp.]
MKIAISACIFAGLLAISACSQSDKAVSELNINSQAIDLLSRMTLEEKIGQIIQADISAVTPEDLKTYNLGSVLNGGNSAPGGGKTAAPEEWVALADAFWTASTDTSDGGIGIPAIWGTDAVHGHNNLQNATMFPHNIGLGAMDNPELMEKIGEITAREIRATGLDWTFAPTLAVAQDDRWGRAYESYSENPAIVAAYAAVVVEGLQGTVGAEDFLKNENVVATAKHFVADGGTELGIDKGDTVGAIDEILATHGAGYQPAIDKGVQVVMASFSSINGDKMHGHEYLLNDVLRDQLGFEGFVVGDWNGHAEVPGCTKTDCPESLHAGVDMYMAPDSWKGLYHSLLAQAKNGDLDKDRLDEAVTRILEVKIRSGLMDAGLPSKRASTNLDNLGADAHTAIAQQAVQESLVLLKNQDGMLPINASSHVLVTGSGADSMQQQTGGWTLNWQGTGNSNDEFGTGETIFAGIQSAMTEQGGSAVHSVDGSFDQKPDVAIVVYGEQPYAEYRGDRSDLVFEFANGENLNLIKSFKDQGIPVVSVFLTGRPLWVNPHLNASDAFVVAWLPGTEGGGVADVIVGDKDGAVRSDFKGRLSFTWPSDGTGVRINSADAPGVLYPFGYGLDYAGETAMFETLSEDAGVASLGEDFGGKIIVRGDAANPFGFYLGDSSNLNVPATALSAASLGGGIAISGTDYKAQEDSRIIHWSGNGEASASIKTLRPVDLSQLGDLDQMSLNLLWRMDSPPTSPMIATMGCGDGCGASLDISDIISSLPEGEWANTAIPVRCFANAGLDTENVNTVLQLTNESAAIVALHSAEIINTGTPASCPVQAN